MPETVFVPTHAELELLRRLDRGEVVPFPENIKKDFSERLYENGFLTVGVDGALALTARGAEVAHSHVDAPA